MFELLTGMIKEEWRMHSSLFGDAMFALFPILLAAVTFAGTVFFSIFTMVFPLRVIALFVHCAFVVVGISVGAFGLLGREAMNRRFGRASLIAYSSRTLPVSERGIFMNFFVKDVLFYFGLWILPLVAGMNLAFPLVAIKPQPLLLLTITLSFLIGLSLAFFLSTIYVHSRRLLAGVLLLAAAFVVGKQITIDSLAVLPSYSFLLSRSLSQLVLSLCIILVPTVFSIFFLKVDFPEQKRRFKNSLKLLSNKLRFTRYSHFVSKDFLDLLRSEGGPGKLIFLFIFPLGSTWLLLSTFFKFVLTLSLDTPYGFDFFLVFSVLLGMISSTVYNWITEYDAFTGYAFLPVKISTVIKSKIRSYSLINLISVVVLLLAAVWWKEVGRLPLALVVFLSVSAYTLAVTIYLGGLYPNILLYNAKIFLEYMLSLIPVGLMLILLSAINISYLWVSPVFAVIAAYIITLSFEKWDAWEQPRF